MSLLRIRSSCNCTALFLPIHSSAFDKIKPPRIERIERIDTLYPLVIAYAFSQTTHHHTH
jgi:hypothetical protein